MQDGVIHKRNLANAFYSSINDICDVMYTEKSRAVNDLADCVSMLHRLNSKSLYFYSLFKIVAFPILAVMKVLIDITFC